MSIRIKNLFFKQCYSDAYCVLLAMQALLSLVDLSGVVFLQNYASFVGEYIAIVNNLISRNAMQTAIYIALTFLFFLPFSYCMYYLAKQMDQKSMALLVVKPTDNKSIFKRLYFTLLVLVLTIGFTWYLVGFGASDESMMTSAYSAKKQYRWILRGEIYAWMGWLGNTVVFSAAIGVPAFL